MIVGCFAKKIKLALAIAGAAAEFTASTQRILFVLFAFGVVFWVTIALWITAFAGVVSSGGFEEIDRSD